MVSNSALALCICGITAGLSIVPEEAVAYLIFKGIVVHKLSDGNATYVDQRANQEIACVHDGDKTFFENFELSTYDYFSNNPIS